VVQVFTSSSRMWAQRPITDEDLLAWTDARARTGVEPAMAHASYLINLGAPGDAMWKQAIRGLTGELARCGRLGIPHLVLHPGSHMGAGEAQGIARIAAAIDAAHDALPDDRTVLLLENTAGQGSCIGHRFEHLRDLLASVAAPSRVGVCLDTQHLHAAGYPIETLAGWNETVDALERTVGTARVRAFHVNDSKKALGARVDRHEHIGRGSLGLEAFRCLLADPRFAGLPMAIETPKVTAWRDDRDPCDVTNLGVLRALEGRARPGARARALATQELPAKDAKRRRR
jgi:deoxyribonuclease IV